LFHFFRENFMKRHIYATFTAAGAVCLVSFMAGCATNGGGGNVLGAVDSGLASMEQSAQVGRQAISSGTMAASGMATVPGQIGLVDILVQQLGISPQQALGGSGAIFQLAQGSMTPQAFSALSQSVPGMTDMLNAAPAVSSPLGMGGVSGLLGNTGAGAAINNAAALASSFQQLNLSPNMVGQFVPIVTDYVRTTSGQVTADLLNSALNVR
jgi:hypothetical protein